MKEKKSYIDMANEKNKMEKQTRSFEPVSSTKSRQSVVPASDEKVPRRVSQKKDKEKKKGFFQRIGKLETSPKTVQDSIPITAFWDDGVIETTPGTYTKTCLINDVNYITASNEEQQKIIFEFQDFLNGFDPSITWEFTFVNREIPKISTLESIRLKPAKDGLDIYRQEVNSILTSSLVKGHNTVKQEKYLTFAVKDINVDHAMLTIHNILIQIEKNLKSINKNPIIPLGTQERLKLLYTIYNQEPDYRTQMGLFDHESDFDLGWIHQRGHSIKDVIAPISFDFRHSNDFMIGDTYASALFLRDIPKELATDFIQEISNIQTNMLLSTTFNVLDTQDSYKLVKKHVSALEVEAIKRTQRNNKEGYFGSIGAELENDQKNSRELLNEITEYNQSLFFISLTITVFSRTKDSLDENVKLVKNIASKYRCTIKPMFLQQEYCFNTSLPLARKDIMADSMYKTLSATVFLPYYAQEISHKNAIFYGLNKITKSMILFDRRKNDNYNGLVFGKPGSGKSFITKLELVNVLLRYPDAAVYVVDPQGEYAPLAKALHGEVVKLRPGGEYHINPLDLDISSSADEDTTPIAQKSDYIQSLMSIIMGNRTMTTLQEGILDKCVGRIYNAYINHLKNNDLTVDVKQCPTLVDLRVELGIAAKQMSPEDAAEANELASYLIKYTEGSFDTFSKRTDIKHNSRFVIYDTQSLGTGMRNLGLFIVMNEIWMRMLENSKRNVWTWFYIDEFHIFLESERTTRFLVTIWKTARKFKGVPTGITQNTSEFMDSAAEPIVLNTSFCIMMSSSVVDRDNLQTLFGLSDSLINNINDSSAGQGLIYNGRITVPFSLEFPTDTKLYEALDTSKKKFA